MGYKEGGNLNNNRTLSVDTTTIATQDYVDNKFNSSLTIDGNLTVNGGLILNTGTQVSKFSTNVENNHNSVPTGQAVQNYVSDNAGGVDWANPVRIAGDNNRVINNVAFCMIDFNSQVSTTGNPGNHDVTHLGGNSWRVRLDHVSISGTDAAAYCFPFK